MDLYGYAVNDPNQPGRPERPIAGLALQLAALPLRWWRRWRRRRWSGRRWRRFRRWWRSGRRRRWRSICAMPPKVGNDNGENCRNTGSASAGMQAGMQQLECAYDCPGVPYSVTRTVSVYSGETPRGGLRARRAQRPIPLLLGLRFRGCRSCPVNRCRSPSSPDGESPWKAQREISGRDESSMGTRPPMRSGTTDAWMRPSRGLAESLPQVW